MSLNWNTTPFLYELYSKWVSRVRFKGKTFSFYKSIVEITFDNVFLECWPTLMNVFRTLPFDRNKWCKFELGLPSYFRIFLNLGVNRRRWQTTYLLVQSDRDRKEAVNRVTLRACHLFDPCRGPEIVQAHLPKQRSRIDFATVSVCLFVHPGLVRQV